MATYPWALGLLVCAVCLPLFRSGITVFAGELALFQPWLEPAGSRAAHVLIHALNSVLVYQLGRKLLRGTTVSFWAALLFAVHPVHLDAIARVPASTDLITGLILFALLMFVLGSRRAAEKPAVRTVSLLSAAVLWLALKGAGWYLVGAEDNPGNPLLAEPASTRFMTGISVLGRYLQLLAWPFRLSPDYSYDSLPVVTRALSPAFLLPLACIALLLVLAAFRARQHNFYLVSCVFLLICAFPVWGLGMPLLAERWLYFPSAAFCWTLALLFRDTGLVPRPDRHDKRFVKSAILLVFFLTLPWSVKTYLRSRQWRDEKVLLQQAAVITPRNARVQLLLGDYRARQGDYMGAQRSYRRVLEIRPGCAAAGLKLAAAYRQTGMYAEALASARQVVPSGARSKAQRAVQVARTFVAMDDYARAAEAFEESLAEIEEDAAVHRELGMLYVHFLGETDRGRRHLRRSLEIDPAQPAADAIRELLARP